MYVAMGLYSAAWIGYTSRSKLILRIRSVAETGLMQKQTWRGVGR